jgi:DNA helicase-2/ATP-dependent DNA helicase PcrA
MEEERRLAYVAMTRTMDRLILTNARMRRHWGEARMNRPSRFIDDIPSECLAVRVQPVPPVDYGSRLKRRAPQPQVSSGIVYDEMDQRAAYDDVPEYDADADLGMPAPARGVRTGATVRHASFGTGRVIQAQGQGKNQKLLIEFPAVGLKTIMARFVEPVA